MKNLNIGSIKIPATAATKAFAVLAKRGAGKTYTAAVLSEEFHAAGIPFVVFDPIDVWWGLRLKADGKAKGLPVVVFGLEHADIQITKDMGRRIAQAIVKENISCVISTFGMGKQAMRHLVAEFADELLKINDTPRHVFIEEAHEFVPQRVMGDGAKCFAAVEALVVMGRNRGIGVTLINQRAATINKDVLTQVDVLLAMRSVGPQDRKSLKDWVEFHAAEGDFDAFLASLPSLPTGEGWLWSPEFMDGVFERIQIRKRETFHVDREKIGTNFKIPKLNQTDIASFVSSFEVKPTPKITATTLPAHVEDGKKKLEEVEKSYKDTIKALEQKIRDYEGFVKVWNAYAKKVSEAANSYPTMFIESVIPDIKTWSNPATFKKLDNAQRDDIAVVTHVTDGSFEATVLGKCERKIYTFLFHNAQQVFSRIQLSAVTGYSVTSGGFKGALSKLISLGMIQKDGDGLSLARASNEDQMFLLEGEVYSASPDYWDSKLAKCERDIYRLLWESKEKLPREDIASITNYSLTSGGFKGALSKLSKLGLISKIDGLYSTNPELLNL